MDVFDNKRIDCDKEQEWKEKNYLFEPDCSPETWKHYEKIYSKQFGKIYIEIKGKSLIGIIEFTDNNRTKRNIEIAGDCSFNFNKKKFESFTQIIKSENNDKKKSERLKLLSECQKMHHTLLNFDLMPRTGGMNNLKGKLKYKDGKIMVHDIGRYPTDLYDRFDTFIYFLNETFVKMDNFKKNNSFDLREIVSFIAIVYLQYQ